MDLNEDERSALRNLALKNAGEMTPWINISGARALTDRGLATRHGGGWTITPEGLTAARALGPAPSADADHQPVKFR